ncbi:hypothetical protein GPECTOR_47g371 [Gonium pectorale]|uniref:DOMON domain-containing protein n=1 Tax=Gonium pectorale TaxID=33097 RepID=A0A150G8D5_GONPE|nr:hypothetical protein GPECTOR_47g371 [Gonium pectorale]|eukprot:KXZ46094.1 hypothetical protein GPECTOR_47g371 [Gonium pectorale]
MVSNARRGSSGGGLRHWAARASPGPALVCAALLLAASSASAASCYRSLSRSDFPHCALLSGTYALHWAVRGDNITLGLDADTGGHPDSWLGLALSDAGGMKGADIIVVAGPPSPASDGEGADGPDGDGDGDDDGSNGPAKRYVAGPGGWRVIDAYSLNFVQPAADPQQDVTLLSAPLSGPNHTVAVVTRRLRTCDPWDRNIQVGIPQTVSWAYGRGWPSKHLARGDSSVFFVPEADRLWGAANATARAPATPGRNATSLTAVISGVAKGAVADVADGATSTANGVANASKGVATAAKGAFQKVANLLSDSDSSAAVGTSASAAAQPRVTGASGPAESEEGTEEEGDGGWASGLSDEPVQELTVVMPNITVPDNATTNYMCTHVTLPNDRKYHIVGFRAIVQSPLIHHMILFACDRPPKPPAKAGDVYECLAVAGGESCATFYVGWAPGQMRGSYPPTVGLPIGEPDSTYFALQIHYNNPELQSGVVDASGFELVYTPRLRPYDAGILTLGQQAIAIPPGQRRVTLRPNVCPSTCTSRLKTPLRLLASGLHMHTLGRSIFTQHIRNGTELPPIGSKRFYDFDFQSSDPVPLDSSILAPGDVLITTCTYDSRGRTNVTRFGESTQDEMCFNFVLYYPKNPDFLYCMAMDAAGDPRVATCAGNNATVAIGATLQQLAQNATAAAAAKTKAADGGSGAVPLPPPAAPAAVNLSAVPTLAPFFRSGSLVRVPAADSVYEPYGRECPDMSYVPAA